MVSITESRKSRFDGWSLKQRSLPIRKSLDKADIVKYGQYPGRVVGMHEGFLDDRLPRVAYFCMEYGLHEELPIYAGGLGILAGDYLKAAHDLGVPVVGLGILWRAGYTNQVIDENGWPVEAESPETDKEDITEHMTDTGKTVTVEVLRTKLQCRIWRVDKYRNAPLYLLDVDLPENGSMRYLTKQLYRGSAQERVAQEIVLGIGGVRALRTLGIDVDVYHFNEGHAVLAGVELIREKMRSGMSFGDAWTQTRRQVIFTTHTPVEAGNEAHDLALLQEVGAFKGLDWKQMEAIGGNPFNMTVAGLRLSCIANGVARLHAQTARRMWRHVGQGAPIVAITNGVHVLTWQDRRMREAINKGEDLLVPHQRCKQELVAEIAHRNGIRLSTDRLLIGFARRAATYKRGDLIFRNPDVIGPLLENGRVQLVFSGKAHPDDYEGKQIVANLVAMSRRYPNSVVFLENYNMGISKLMTRGCDVWLNNPRRPLEASGTSGMKAALNGVLNLSVLDGWWPECCRHGVNGWQIGDGYTGDDQDERDMKSLYRVLLEEVIPLYYNEKDQWREMMRASILSTRVNFSAARMLQQYYAWMYDTCYCGRPEIARRCS